jgi:hypothetical protein
MQFVGLVSLFWRNLREVGAGGSSLFKAHFHIYPVGTAHATWFHLSLDLRLCLSIHQ